MAHRSRRRALPFGLALMCCGLAGCTLIDQRYFDPEAGKRPVIATPAAPPAPAPEYGRPALFSVKLPLPSGLAAAIAKPVAAARARKADVVFQVVEITGEAGTTVGGAAEQVGRAIVAAGVPPGRVELAVRPAAAALPEVRVYVR